jgi:hypothetical protein
MANQFGQAPEAFNDIIRTAGTQPMMIWLGVQGEMLSRLGEMAEMWGQHRREDGEATRDALNRMSNAGDPSEAASIYADWLRTMVQRLSNDYAQWAGQSQALFSTGMSGLQRMQEQGVAAERRMAEAAQ